MLSGRCERVRAAGEKRQNKKRERERESWEVYSRRHVRCGECSRLFPMPRSGAQVVTDYEYAACNVAALISMIAGNRESSGRSLERTNNAKVLTVPDDILLELSPFPPPVYVGNGASTILRINFHKFVSRLTLSARFTAIRESNDCRDVSIC